MSSDKKFYITTTLPYVNGNPHIGFAMELIRADVLARYYQGRGYKIFFNTGTDEHGAKLYEKAHEAGLTPKQYVDQQAEPFSELTNQLNISNTVFTRTTNPAHKQAAQAFWKLCVANGDIYKKHYQAQYCVGCELEKTDSELVSGRCPLHPDKELQQIEEENYFFKFSKYQDHLLQKPKLVFVFQNSL